MRGIQFFFILPWFCLFASVCAARVLSPEEAKILLARVVEQSTARDYWGVWQFRDGVTGKECFVEVLFLRGTGFAWKILGEESVVNIRLGNCRYVVNLKSGEVESIYPIVEFPFAPLEQEVFPLLLENYFFEFRDHELILFSKRTGEAVCSLLLDEEGGIIGQRIYAPEGELVEEWRLMYRDVSPDFSWVSRLVYLLDSLKEKVPQRESLLTRLGERVVLPDFVPLGFQLRRVYLLRDGKREFYGFVYTDGFLSFILLRSVYPFQVSGSRVLRYFRFVQEGRGVQIAAEKEGFYFLLVGGLDPRVGEEILKSFSKKGGRK
ncbi:hypothetical protein [Candidatus Caldatribacterium sp.]|uniref:hypothetical protein n=1 Tax=Candidatus Caldatribacterium sp. TaxID=2282143 RepID=UPI002990EA26|nr:hypothetical protein [Candidatus Caldatribacterium sp.]MDW8080855.1 hypothetical protein [Candidatus Calescibacterium sp.]